MATYLEIIIDRMSGAAAAANEALAAAGLPELVDFYQGEPEDIRQTNCPYGWWEWRDSADAGALYVEVGETVDFRAHFMVVLGLAAPTPEELVALVASVPPRVIAAIEQLDWPYVLVGEGVAPGPFGDGPGNFRVVAMPFSVLGRRALGGVS